MDHLDTIKSIYYFIENKDDDVIVRGWEKKDSDKKYPINQGEANEASKFLYVRDGFLSRIWQKITDWTGDAKRKQILAKKYINDQLSVLENSSKNSEIKTCIDGLRIKINGVSGDLKVIHIKEGLKNIMTFLEAEKTGITVESIQEQSVHSGKKQRVDEHGYPVIHYNPTDFVSLSLDGDPGINAGNPVINIDNEIDSHSDVDNDIDSESGSDDDSIVNEFENINRLSDLSVIFQSQSQPQYISTTASDRKDLVNNALLKKEAPVSLQVVISDENFEATKIDRNSSLLCIPEGKINVGSKHSAGEFDADYYVFPTGEDKKIPPQIVKEKIIEITTPQLKRVNPPFGTTIQNLNTYGSNLLSAYRQTFEQIERQIASNSKDSFSLSIKMPVTPKEALNKANQVAAQALLEFLSKHRGLSVYIQTSGLPVSEDLLAAIKSNRTAT